VVKVVEALAEEEEEEDGDDSGPLDPKFKTKPSGSELL